MIRGNASVNELGYAGAAPLNLLFAVKPLNHNGECNGASYGLQPLCVKL